LKENPQLLQIFANATLKMRMLAMAAAVAVAVAVVAAAILIIRHLPSNHQLNHQLNRRMSHLCLPVDLADLVDLVDLADLEVGAHQKIVVNGIRCLVPSLLVHRELPHAVLLRHQLEFSRFYAAVKHLHLVMGVVIWS
jgi:hypothetical protein